MPRQAAVILTALHLIAFPVRAQFVAPVAAQNHVSTSRAIPVAIEAEGNRVGAAPFVVIGALVGAGAVTAFWVHEIQVSVRKNGDDGFGFIPPIVFVTIGAGGVGGGVLGWMIHDAITQTPQ